MNPLMQSRCPTCGSFVDLQASDRDGNSSCRSCGYQFEKTRIETSGRSVPDHAGLFLHYELRNIVGQGASGTVWRAFDTRLDRTVALKICRMLGIASDDSRSELIVREARIVAQLHHPGIIPVHEAGIVDGVAYIATGFVEGQDLKHYLRDRDPLEPASVARICLQLSEALAHAHSRGIIHRDLKPGNILIDSQGSPRIADFGLAKREYGDITLTLHGQSVGTPAYMSPEQALGESRFIDRRADLYSMGVILFELLTGQQPFSGDTGNLLLEILTREPPVPRQLRKNIPIDLETICLRCMEKNPLHRYQSADELTEELRRFLSGKPIKARPIGVWGRSVKWSRRNPGWASVFVVVILALAGMIGGSLFYNVRLSNANNRLMTAIQQVREERQSAETQRQIAEERKKEAENTARVLAERELAGRKLLYVDDIRQANEFWKTGNLEKMFERLNRHVPERGESDIRGFEWYYLKSQCRMESDRMIDTSGNPLFDVAISPDGRLIASGGEEGLLRIHEVVGRSVQEIRSSDGTIETLEFSPDGRYLSVGTSTGKLAVYRTADWSTEIQFNAHSKSITSIAFSPDGTLLVSGSDDGSVAMWEFPSAILKDRLPPHVTPIESVAISSDRLRLAVSSSDGWLKVLKLPNGKPDWQFRHEEPVRSICFGRARQELVVGCHDGRVRVFPQDSSEPRLILGTFSEPVQSVAFGEDDQLIAAADKKGQLRLWDADSGLLRSVAHCPGGRIFSLAHSPTDRLLVTADRQGCLRFWDQRCLPIDLVFESRFQISDLSMDNAGSTLVAAQGSHATCLEPRMLMGLPTPFLKQKDGYSSRFPVRWNRKQKTHALALSHDGQLVACGETSNQISVLDAKTGIMAKNIILKESPVYFSSLVFSQDDLHLLASGVPGVVSLFDVATSETLLRIDAESEQVLDATFTDDESRILFGGNRVVGSIEPETHEITRLSRPPFLVKCIAVSPDEKIAVSGGDNGTLTFWKCSPWEEIGTIKTSADLICSIAFAPDGQTVAVGTNNHKLTFWSVDTLQELFSLSLKHVVISALAFEQSGAYLAVGTSSLQQGEPIQGQIEILSAVR